MILYSDLIRQNYNLLAIFFDHLLKLGMTDKEMVEIGNELREDISFGIWEIIENSLILTKDEKEKLNSSDKNTVYQTVDRLIEKAKNDNGIMENIRDYVHDVLADLNQEMDSNIKV